MEGSGLYYKTAYKFNPRNDVLWSEIARYFKKYIKSSDSVLDLGAGYCYFINNLECKRKVAIDIYPQLSKFCKDKVECYVMSYNKLDGYFTTEFDVVFTSNFFEHLSLEECQDCLKKIKSILKPNGKLIIIQPNYRYCYRQYFDDYTHKTIFDDKSICQFLGACGFEPLVVQPKFMPYTSRGKSFIINKYLIRGYLYSFFKPFAGQMLIISRLNSRNS